MVQRAITGYHFDEDGDWVAHLSCGHRQHVRHRPPFQLREWVLDAEQRRARIGTALKCPLCDRAELPDGLRLVRTSPLWDEHTMPVGLRRSHRIAAGTWGRVVVHDGHLQFTAQTDPEIQVVLGSSMTQAIPPEVEHKVQPLIQVRFSIDFFSVAAEGEECAEVAQYREDLGGETACWAHLLCNECGTVLDGGPHSRVCTIAKRSDSGRDGLS
jgi:tellurite methyltransferase